MLAVKGARVIDGTGSAPVDNCNILVEDEKIIAVGPDAVIPEDATVFYARGRTVIPALSDAHTHFSGSSGFDRPGFGLCRESYEYSEAREMCMRWGVTAVRSCGDVSPDILMFRDSQRDGTYRFPTPRVVAVGPWFQKDGGHPAFTVGPQVGLKDPEIMARACVIVNDDTDIVSEVNRVVDMNVDAVKVFMAHVNKGNYPIPVPQLSEEELQLIVDTAHGRGKKVFCHVDGSVEMMIAAKCGVDSIEHVIANGSGDTEIPDELIEILLEKNIAVVPTMISIQRWDHQVPGATPVYPYLKKAVKKLYDAGVKLYVGCDSGIPFVPFGVSVQDEMICMAEAGIPPMDIIRMATLENARLMELDDEIGSIEPGKDADFIILHADPLSDIANAKEIDTVFMKGHIVSDRKGA